VAGKQRLVYGVGVNDWNCVVTASGKLIDEYCLWKHMLERCFSNNFKQKHPTYTNVICCNDWLCMTKFIEDVSKLKGYGLKGWQLDKDILQKGNKLYSKDTCCFVPKEVNYLLTKSDKTRGEWPIGVSFFKITCKFQASFSINGKKRNLGYFNTPEEAFQAYKTAKEAHIKAVATKWKDQLDERVYQALINYTVSIDD